MKTSHIFHDSNANTSMIILTIAIVADVGESPVSERIVTPLQSTTESEMRLVMRVYHFLVDLRLRSRPFFLQKPSKK